MSTPTFTSTTDDNGRTTVTVPGGAAWLWHHVAEDRHVVACRYIDHHGTERWRTFGKPEDRAAATRRARRVERGTIGGLGRNLAGTDTWRGLYVLAIRSGEVLTVVER